MDVSVTAERGRRGPRRAPPRRAPPRRASPRGSPPLPVVVVVALAWALAAGCGDSEIWAGLPPLAPEVNSWVIAARARDEVRLFAGDREHGTRVDFADAELELRGLTVPLAQLGLAPGPFASDTSAMGLVLPSPSGVFATAVAEGEALAWRALDAPALTEGVRTPPRDACDVLTARVQSLPTTNDVRWGVTVDARTVLLGSGEASVMRVRAGGAPQVLPIVTSTIVRPNAALLDRQSRLWMVDDRLRLWVAPLDEDVLRPELVVASSTPSDGLPVVLEGDDTRPDAELYTITTRGVVLRRSGSGWARLGELPRDDTGVISHDLVWVGTEHVLASVDTEHAVYRWRDGELTRVDPATDSRAGVVALGTLAPGVAVAATSDGELSRYTDGVWQSLGEGPITLDPLAFLPQGSGFYYAGYRGAVAQWHPTLGYCPTPGMRALAGDTVFVLLRLGGAFLATGSAPRGDGLNTYTLIDRD